MRKLCHARIDLHAALLSARFLGCLRRGDLRHPDTHEPRSHRHRPARELTCALPPITLASSHVAQVRRYTEAIARGVGVRGLLNVQYALKD
ncbi:hypothetical protein, partial [Micromonospora craterilacus]|uniref:hypothetical protein n=1 Tax=Micromonospora craterilacus TaxID=1655439 RepID=UPI001F2EB27D